MIATTWNRFHWNVSALPTEPLLKEPFSVRRARPDEKEKVLVVALDAVKMNTDWHDATDEVTNFIKQGVDLVFAQEHEPACFVIAHGLRIVGVAMVDPRLEAEYHLLSGPWVLSEYRNRGFGTALLYASLRELATHGITDVYGLTRANTAAARFVYPKFGGVMSNNLLQI